MAKTIKHKNLFQQLEYEAFRDGITPRSKQSRAWFRKKAQAITSINRTQLMKSEPLLQKNDIMLGRMFMYFYDPKHKKTLPYYDKFPLTIIVDNAPGGFAGINLHYLPMTLRARFLDGLLDITNNKSYNDTMKFRLSYQMMKAAAKMKYFRPCYKHYLLDHVRSNFALVPAPEWEIATFLPTQNFAKASEQKVWGDSRKMIS